MALVRTVTGDIDAAELGFTMAHEHVFLDVAGHGSPDIERSLYDWDKRFDMMKKYRAAGGGALIDANPLSADGRDPARLYTISKQSGVKVVACTGFVKENPYTDNTRILRNKTVSELADFFVREIEVGMDGTDIKAGWIKSGSLYQHITPLQENCLRAGAIAAMRTGVSMHTHTEVGTCCLEQIEIVESEGMDLTRFCLAHVDRNPDLWLHRKICEKGCYIIYDGPGKTKFYPDSVRIDLLRKLVDDGFGKQIMLSNDMGRRDQFPQYGGGPGWTWLKERFLPRLLDEGFSQQTIDDFMINNPARFYSMK